MNAQSLIVPLAAALVFTKWAAQLTLEWLNRRNVLRNKVSIPEAFRETVDPATYSKSINYTLAKSRFRQIELTYEIVILAVTLFSGILPGIFAAFSRSFGHSAWASAAYLFAVGIVLALTDLPFSWYSQFRLEERFGFNTTSQKLWWMDRVKGFFLALLLGYPFLVLVLKIVDWTGSAWWLWAWGSIMAFQLLMLILAPILILPLFNKFTPLPEGRLRDRLSTLGERTGFRAKTIQVMDGSKRSRHSNAFFTGFGRFRKIVLFDTLIQQLTESELEAVLAHEIGHYKRKHIPKMLIWSTISLFAGLYVVAWLARQEWFYSAFGFEPGSIVPALLLFSLLSGTITFWFSPLANFWSRRYEYQADAYAATIMKERHSLTLALRKLNEKNLSNLTPHHLYSGFYYSHPSLLERESALRQVPV